MFQGEESMEEHSRLQKEDVIGVHSRWWISGTYRPVREGLCETSYVVCMSEV